MFTPRPLGLLRRLPEQTVTDMAAAMIKLGMVPAFRPPPVVKLLLGLLLVGVAARLLL
jgi:hypothetical protein